MKTKVIHCLAQVQPLGFKPIGVLSLKHICFPRQVDYTIINYVKQET